MILMPVPCDEDFAVINYELWSMLSIAPTVNTKQNKDLKEGCITWQNQARLAVPAVPYGLDQAFP